MSSDNETAQTPSPTPARTGRSALEQEVVEMAKRLSRRSADDAMILAHRCNPGVAVLPPV